MTTTPTPRVSARRPSWPTWTAVLLLPILMGALLMWAFQDETHQVKNLTAAIVNNDEPVKVKGQLVPLGRLLSGNLVDGAAPNMSWVLTDAADAEKGLAESRYVAVLSIPKEFSAAATSSATTPKDPERAVLTVDSAVDRSLLDTAVAPNVARAAAQALSATLAGSTIENLYLGYGTLAENLRPATSGAMKLADGLSSASDGSAKLADGLDEASTGLSKLAGGTRQLTGGVTTLVEQTKSSVAAQRAGLPGLRALADGAKGVSGGVSTLVTTTKSTLTTQEKALPQLKALSDGAAQVSGGAAAMSPGTAQLATGAKQLADGMGQWAGGAVSYAANASLFADGAQELTGGVDKLAAGSASLARGAGEATSVASSVAEGAAELSTGVTQLVGASKSTAAVASRLRQLATTCTPTEDTCTELRAIAADIPVTPASELDALTTGASRVKAGTAGVVQAVGELKSGALQLQGGAQDLKESTAPLASGAAGLAGGAQALQSGATRFPAAADQLSAGATQLSAGQKQLAAGAAQVAGGVETLYSRTAAGVATGKAQVGQLDQLSSGAAQVATGVRAVHDQTARGVAAASGSVSKLDQLVSGADALAAGMDAASTGVGSAATGATSLDKGLVALQKGADDLATGLGKASAALPKYTESQTKSLATMSATPVTSQGGFWEIGTGQGHLMSITFFSTLALWFGSFGMFLAVSLIPSHILTSRRSTWALVGRAVAFLAGIALVQAMGLGALTAMFENFGAGTMLTLWGVLFVVGLVFLLVNAVLGEWLGVYGRYAALVILLITLIGGLWSGGPGFFTSALALLPTNGAMQVLRAALSEGAQGFAGAVNLGTWALVAAALLALAMERRRSADPSHF